MPETPRPSLHHDTADTDLASAHHPAQVRVRPSNNGLKQLLAHVQPLGRVRMAVVHPYDATSLTGALAQEHGLDITGMELQDVPHSHAAVRHKNTGLCTQRRISHCYLMQTPTYPRPFIIMAAACTKGLVSEVAGQADVLVVPDLESGNMRGTP